MGVVSRGMKAYNTDRDGEDGRKMCGELRYGATKFCSGSEGGEGDKALAIPLRPARRIQPPEASPAAAQAKYKRQPTIQQT